MQFLFLLLHIHASSGKMIEQALQVLTLHIFWKMKGLTADEEPTPEEIRYKETLVEERDSLLEKLSEYAIGTQSNTVEGVKRAVRDSDVVCVFLLITIYRPSVILSIYTYYSLLPKP